MLLYRACWKRRRCSDLPSRQAMGDLRASVGEKDDAQPWLQVAVFGERANTRSPGAIASTAKASSNLKAGKAKIGWVRSVPAGRAIIVIKPAMADIEPA